MGDKILKSLQFPGSSDVYKIPQSDYAQTDSTQPDYIKNKLVGKEVENFEIIPEQTTSFTEQPDGSVGASLTFNEMPTVGEIYSVTYEGGEYEVEALDFFGITIIGDPYHMGMGEEMIYPFLIIFVEGTASAICSGKTAGDTMTISIKIKKEVTKKLTAEYLEPFEVVTKGGDTLTWDGNTSGLESVDMSGNGSIVIYKVTDVAPVLSDFANGCTCKIASKDTHGEGKIDITEILDLGNGLLIGFLNNYRFVVCPSDNFEFEGNVLYKGTYLFIVVEDGIEMYCASLTIPNYTGFITTEKKLKGEYLIDTNSIILKSSGGKRFRVTVSDTGTLTATEI